MSENKIEPSPTSAAEPDPEIYSPNASYLLNMIDKMNHFVEGAKKMEDSLDTLSAEIGNVTKMSTDKLSEKIEELGTGTTREMLEKYKKMREEFELIETNILKEASRMLGFEQRDYLIKPLKDLIDQIKEGTLNPEEAVNHFQKLFRTIGINKAIIYTQMIPYVGEIIYSILNNLDNVAASRVVMDRFLELLKNLGLQEDKLEIIKSYTTKSYFTRKYDLFRSWLANGAEMPPLSFFSLPPLSSFYPSTIFKKTQAGIMDKISTFFNDPKDIPKEQKKVGGESENTFVDNWIFIKSLKRKTNKKTKRSIHTINKSIKAHLTRLRRTRRKPL